LYFQGQLSQAKQQLTGQLNHLANNVLTVEPAARPSSRSSPAPGSSKPGRAGSVAAQAQAEALEATAALDGPEHGAYHIGGTAFDDISLHDGSAPSSPTKGLEMSRVQQENRQLKQRLQQVQDAATEALGAPQATHCTDSAALLLLQPACWCLGQLTEPQSPAACWHLAPDP
jgi:hypothetical protein